MSIIVRKMFSLSECGEPGVGTI